MLVVNHVHGTRKCFKHVNVYKIKSILTLARVVDLCFLAEVKLQLSITGKVLLRIWFYKVFLEKLVDVKIIFNLWQAPFDCPWENLFFRCSNLRGKRMEIAQSSPFWFPPLGTRTVKLRLRLTVILWRRMRLCVRRLLYDLVRSFWWFVGAQVPRLLLCEAVLRKLVLQ